MNRARMVGRRLAVAVMLGMLLGMAVRAAGAPVEQWGIHEIELRGPSAGNPFVDVELSARFLQGERAITVSGFYDGDGIYRVRFMPERRGEWRYETRSNRAELNGKKIGPHGTIG